jgi:hypothetical protein
MFNLSYAGKSPTPALLTLYGYKNMKEIMMCGTRWDQEMNWMRVSWWSKYNKVVGIGMTQGQTQEGMNGG